MPEPDRVEVIKDLIPATLASSDAAGYLVQFLRDTYGTRSVFSPSDNGDNKPLPAPAMPGYVHLALSAIASHPGTAYRGNVGLLVKDAVFMVLGAYAHVLGQAETAQSSEEDKEAVRMVAHVVRAEEVMRQALLTKYMGLAHVFDILAVGQVLSLSKAAGDRQEIFDQLEKVFHHVDQMPTRVLKHQLVRLIYGMPEVQTALGYLTEDLTYQLNPAVQAWTQRLDEVAQQVNKESPGNGSTN